MEIVDGKDQGVRAQQQLCLAMTEGFATDHRLTTLLARQSEGMVLMAPGGSGGGLDHHNIATNVKFDRPPNAVRHTPVAVEP